MDKKLSESKDSTSRLEFDCKVCSCRFATFEESLKHEILIHSFIKNRPSKSLTKQIKILNENLTNADNKDWQAKVEAAIDNCQRGEELKAILKLYCIDTEKLEQAYMHIFKCMQTELKKLGKFSIYPFGSVANGLALKSSDIDIYIESDESSDYTKQHFRLIFNRVTTYIFRSDCFTDVVPIRQARVPIIKCKHSPSGYNIDINMTCPSSVYNTNFIRDIVRSDTRLHQLCLFLKIWSKHLQIIGRSGAMNSYCLITLIIYYLQNTPNKRDEPEQPILPSIEQLQEGIPAKIVEVVNYAYDLKKIPPLDKHHSVRSLIQGFFLFYHKFDFINNIVSAFYGKQISRTEFLAENNKFKVYKDQLRALNILNGTPAKPLQIQNTMCVQDAFCLNLNVSRSVTACNLEYICHCFSSAKKYCTSEISNAEFYKVLFYYINNDVAKVDSEASTSDNSKLTFTITPSRAEMRALTLHGNKLDNGGDSLNKVWVNHYIELVKDVLSDIYKFDVQKAQWRHCSKNQKLQDSELAQSWVLNGSVDLWTGRTFVKNTLFMEHESRLTNTFQKQRRQNSSFSAQFNALLTIIIPSDYSSITLKIQQMEPSSEDINKRSPLCKFFRNFRNCMQNCNFKEKLLTASEKFLLGLSNPTFKTENEVETEN